MKYRMDEITESCLGKMLDSKKNKGEYQPYLANINVRWGSFDLNNLSLMRFEPNENDRYGIKYGDLIMCEGGEPGRCAIWRDELPNMKIQKALHRIRPNTNLVDVEYLYYWFLLSGKNDLLRRHFTETTIKHLPGETLKQLVIDLPDMKIQKNISTVLRSIDKKITVNEKINDNLEQQAAALFSSLYNRSNTEVRYTDLIQILGGGTPKTGETAYWNGNIAFFTPKDVGTPYTFITEKTITEEGLSHCNSRLYPVNTVFVTARGTVGKVGLSGVPMAMNQSCYALVGKETHQLLVYFYTLKVVDKLKHKASGAVFDAITTRDFESEQIMKLSDDDARAFLCVAEPMFQDILNNSIENLRLSTLRDFLLPKLMSGEIDVSNIQF